MKYQYSPEEQAFMQDKQERMKVYSVEECVQHGIDFFERNNLPWFEVDLDLLHMEHYAVCMAGQLAGNFRSLFWDIAHDFELSWVVARTMKFCDYLGLSVYNEEDYPALQAEWVRRIHDLTSQQYNAEDTQRTLRTLSARLDALERAKGKTNVS